MIKLEKTYLDAGKKDAKEIVLRELIGNQRGF